MTEWVADAVQATEVLQSMYFDEFCFATESDDALFQYLRDNETLPPHKPDKLEWDINVPVLSSPAVINLLIHVTLSLTGPGIQLTIPSLPNPWLNRDTQERLSREAQDAIQQHTDPDLIDRASCLIEVLQHTRDSAEFLALEHAQQVKESEVQTDQGPVVFVREWIWFPMIYTREKRGHIIKWAPKYGLTGFLCPGKPGALCLEGTGENVTVFINDIKTLSWADIPASHRKMTSRWQQRVTCESKQELEKQRLFNDMTEVTFELHGAFGNHNNLNMLSDWMKSKGCGDAFYHLFEYEDDGSKKA